jgi:regulator of RNase E activity RraA
MVRRKNMALWQNDQELFTLARRDLFTAVVGDVMDKMELKTQFLPPQIKALRQDMVVIGRAMPVLSADVFGESVESSANPVMAQPFGLMLPALDDLQPDEVYLCTGGTPNYALWGELMTTRAMKLQAAGVVLDGYLRDTMGILRLNFPSFAYGSYAQDQGPRGKVIDFRVSVKIGAVSIQPGDIVFGDVDGVCIIPRRAEEEVFRKALEKVEGENLVRQAIEEGMSTVEAFAKYRIM